MQNLKSSHFKFYLLTLSSTVLLSGCADSALTKFFGGENQEIRDIAKAQSCLDDVSSSNPAAADQCLPLVASYESQQAQILKCSIWLTSGGLTTNKIVQAYEVTKDSTLPNKEAVYIGFLSLDVPNVNAGYVKAQTAYPFCERSQVTGLEFIAGLAKIGSMIASVNGSAFDLNDPAATQAAVESVIDTCVNNGSSCDLNDLGTTLATVSQSYCNNPSSDQEVCADVNAAISSAGGNAALAAQEFLCQLKGQTFNGSNACI